MPRTIALLCLLLPLAVDAQTVIRFATPQGDFEVELFDAEAPATVANFLAYVDSGRYANSFVHRSVPDFVIQGGAFTFTDAGVDAVPTFDPVVNEFGRSNERGTLAMAKVSGDPDSATSSWFINVVDNPALDTDNGGFTVFGQVLGNGMAVVDAINALQAWNAGSPFQSIPLIDYPGSGEIDASHLVFTEVTVVSGEDPEPVPFAINAGVGGAWFDPDTAGQGFLIDVIDGDPLQLFVAWFTYDTDEPKPDESLDFGSEQQRWFTAVGPVDGDTATLALQSNSGGVFNDPRETQADPVGSLTITFSSCTEARADFQFTTEDGGSGQIDLIRLTPDLFCSALSGN